MLCRQNEREIARMMLNKFYSENYDKVKGSESLPIVTCSFLKEKMIGELYVEVIFNEKEICQITCPYVQIEGNEFIKPIFHDPEICEDKTCEEYKPKEKDESTMIEEKVAELRKNEVEGKLEEMPGSLHEVKDLIDKIKEEGVKSVETQLSNEVDSTQKEIHQIVSDNEESIDLKVIQHLQENGANLKVSDKKIQSLALSEIGLEESSDSFEILASEGQEIVTGVEISAPEPSSLLRSNQESSETLENQKQRIVFPGPDSIGWVLCDESLRLHGTEATLRSLGLHASETASTKPINCRAKFDNGVKVKLSFGASEDESCHSHLIYPIDSETAEVEPKSGDCIEGRGFHPAVIDSEPKDCDEFNFNRAFAFFRSEEGGKMSKAFIENVVRCEEVSGRGVVVRLDLKFNGKRCGFEMIFNKRGESKEIGRHNCPLFK